MTDAIDPRLLACAFSMLRPWGLKGSLLQLVRLATVDHQPAMPRTRLSQREGAHLLCTDPRHVQRHLRELVVDHGVLERDPPYRLGLKTGTRPLAFWFTDPRGWRDVPWRFEPDLLRPHLPPAAVLDRLAQAVTQVRPEKVGLVTRYNASLRTFVTRAERVTDEALRRAPRASLEESLLRAPRASLEADEPSSTSSGLAAPVAAPRSDGSDWDIGPSEGLRGEKDRTRRSGGGDLELSGAAAVVAQQIVLTGAGPLASARLRDQLAEAFEDFPPERVPMILARLERAAANDQRVPALVALACQLAAAGADAILRPDGSVVDPDARLVELKGRRRQLAAELEMARDEAAGTGTYAEHSAEVAEMLADQLARCDNDIETVTRWRDARRYGHLEPQSQATA